MKSRFLIAMGKPVSERYPFFGMKTGNCSGAISHAGRRVGRSRNKRIRIHFDLGVITCVLNL